jgi:hypothetical protein
MNLGFSIKKIRLWKCSFGKNRIGVSVIDMSDYYDYLRIMTFQFWFKKGFCVFYELHENN